MSDPAIIVIAPEHGDELRTQFRRYEGEYTVVVAPDLASAAAHGSVGGRRAALTRADALGRKRQDR